MLTHETQLFTEIDRCCSSTSGCRQRKWWTNVKND